MAVSVENFISKPQQFEGLQQGANIVQNNRDRNFAMQQRLESRKTATSQFLTNYLDKKDFLTGTVYDGIVGEKIQGARQQGFELAGKGASIPYITMAIQPLVSELNEYSIKAKTISKQIDADTEALKGIPGYNPSAIREKAFEEAFYTDGKLKNIRDVDPATKYAKSVIDKYPSIATTSEGLDNYLKSLSKDELSQTITTSGAPGHTRKTRIKTIMPFYGQLDTDDEGNIAVTPDGRPTSIVPKFENIIGKDGKNVRLLKQEEFSHIMSRSPAIWDHIRGRTEDEFVKPLQDAGDEDIDITHPAAVRYARKIMYEHLAKQKGSSLLYEDEPKTSAAATKMEMYMNPETRRTMKEIANLGDGGGSGGGSLKEYKTNTVDAIGRVFNNDPEYLSGAKTKIDGKDVIDITSVLPGGELKFGRGEEDRYRSIFFDPSKRELIVQKEAKDAYGDKQANNTVIKESEAGQFIRQIAEANGVPLPAVKKLLESMNYKNGKFNNVAQPEGETPKAEKQEAKSYNTWDRVKGWRWPRYGGKPAAAKGRPSLDSFDKSNK